MYGADLRTRISSDSTCWALAVRAGAVALCGEQMKKEVVIIQWEFTPHGVMYRLDNPDIEEWAQASLVTPIVGRTQLALVNLMDGSDEPVGTSLPWFVEEVAVWFHRPKEV